MRDEKESVIVMLILIVFSFFALILTVLKLANVISLPWIWIASPFWISILVLLGVWGWIIGYVLWNKRK